MPLRNVTKEHELVTKSFLLELMTVCIYISLLLVSVDDRGKPFPYTWSCFNKNVYRFHCHARKSKSKTIQWKKLRNCDVTEDN